MTKQVIKAWSFPCDKTKTVFWCEGVLYRISGIYKTKNEAIWNGCDCETTCEPVRTTIIVEWS